MKNLLLTTLICAGLSISAFAQGENLKVPEGWEIRTDQPMDDLVVTDDPEAEGLYFVNMTPGWHITTGPRAILWNPSFMASGDFTINATLYLFNPEGRNREGYGLFFAGEDLKGEGQEYVYFLLRNTGDFLVKKRMGDETSVIKDWTASEHIVKYEDESVSSVKNDLAVSVSEGMVSFHINGEVVYSMETSDMKTDGTFGLRINHAVNLHVGELAVTDM